MPKYPPPEPSTAPRIRSGADLPTQRLRPPTETPAPASAEAPEAAKTPDLTVNKVIAGAGAAATSAVLGSYFGAAGTVTGAALGSVASTIATVVYQRSLDRTRDTLVARVRLTPGRRGDVAEAHMTLPAQRVAPDAETVRLRVEPDLPATASRRRPWLWLAATVLVFAIGLLAVTGLEWAKGSTLTTGESGTSVGRVIDGNGGAAAPTAEPEPTQNPTQNPEPSSSAEPSAEPTEEPTATEAPEPGATQTPDESANPGLGNDEGSDGSGNGNGDEESGANPTPLLPTPGE
jgi:hypothetical protein